MLLASSSFTVWGQDDGSDEKDYFYMSSITDIHPKHSFTVEVGMPIMLGNKFRKTYMDGLVYFSPYYQFTFENNLAIGAGAIYNFYKIKSLATYENIYGGSHSVGAFFKIAHEKFHSTRFGTDIGVKMGAMQAFYNSNKLKDLGKKSADLGVYIEPNIGFVLTVSEKSSFRFVAGYSILSVPFTNETIGMEAQGGMAGKDFRKIQQGLVLGFGYTFYAKTR